MFDERSRYAGLGTRARTGADGRTVIYLLRRLVPPADSYVVADGINVTDSDRIDMMAYRGLGTPAAFWQIADANGAMHPGELTATPGRRLIVPMPRIAGSTGR